MAKSVKTCLKCSHCCPRHHKPDLNTGGDYVCLVLGSLIPDAYVESTLCSGVWFDRAGASEWISTAEAADILGVGRIRVTQLINAGQIRAEKVGNRYNVDRASVEERAANPPKAGRRW